MTRLVIISHTPHYRRGDTFVGWGATVLEIDQLATLFDDVVHVAPLHSGAARSSDLPYENPRVKLCPVAPTGGDTLMAKLGILAHAGGYLKTIHREVCQADVVHVRCPAAISLLAVAFLSFQRRPKTRWIKYAGSWQDYEAEPWSYHWQRWLLTKNFAKSWVTVNGEWESQPAHIVPFMNPCLSRAELDQGRKAAADKRLSMPIRLMFVGRVEERKGAGRAVRIVAELAQRDVPAKLDLIGEGPAVGNYRELAQQLGVADRVRFLGGCPRPLLGEHYAAAHFLLLPTTASEGWPKVASEAMAYGTVPLAGSVGSIPQNVQRFGCGVALPGNDVRLFTQEIQTYCAEPRKWRAESVAATEAAAEFTYESYLDAVRRLLGEKTAEPDLVAETDRRTHGGGATL